MTPIPRASVLAALALVCVPGWACSCGAQEQDQQDGSVEAIRLDLSLQFSCATSTKGEVQCWGRGGGLGYGEDSGQNLGDDESLASWGFIDAGGAVLGAAPAVNTGCLAYVDGTVRCWGSATTGMLGSGDTAPAPPPPAQRPPVSLAGTVVGIAGWSGRVCVIFEDGTAQCWGFNENGELGYGHTDNIGDDELPSSAGTLAFDAPLRQIVLGDGHSCALIEGGEVKCWGQASLGQLGRGSEESIGDDEDLANLETVDLGPSPVVQLAAGNQHTCARHEDGGVSCWGAGSHGRLGYPELGGADLGDNEAPVAAGTVELGAKAVDVAAGKYHSCAVLEGGEVRCWGDAARGQLGLASTERIGDDEDPAEAPTLRLSGPAVDLALGSEHSCARLESGQVQCWGFNQFGQLGYGHTETIGDDEHPESAGFVQLGSSSP